MDLRGYLGLRGRRRVLGRWKETEVRFLRYAWELVPARAAFFAALAFAFCEAAIDKAQYHLRLPMGIYCVPLGAELLALVVFALAILSSRRDD